MTGIRFALILGITLQTGFVATLHAAGAGELVIVANQEPQSMQAQVTYKEINGVGLRNVIENLTRLDPETNEVLPMLALSWEQVEPTVWQFKLREGVSFHDGTPLDAKSAAVSLNWLYDEGNSFSIREMMGPQITAAAVDDMTVAITTESPDPLLPRRIYLAGLTSAKQILENPADHDVTPIGTGPYVFDEWKQGQYWTAKANAEWWGNDADDTYGEIHFDSLRVVWRPEPVVRSAMVDSNEAHIAMFLTKEECDRFTEAAEVDCIVKGSDTFLSFRLDYTGAHPLMEDLNFRKAIYTGIDWEGIRVNLMGLGEPLAGQLLPAAATGFHDGISQYPYDPEGAKALVDELKADGQEIPTLHIATRQGSTPRNGEMVEAIGAMLGAVGIQTTVAVEEPGVFNPRATTKPDPSRAAAWLHPQGNPLMDYAAQFSAHYVCDSHISVFCDPDFDTRAAVAGSLVGEERHQALRELVKEGHDRYVMGAVGLLQRAYGVPAGFKWDFGLDHRVLAVNMKTK